MTLSISPHSHAALPLSAAPISRYAAGEFPSDPAAPVDRSGPLQWWQYVQVGGSRSCAVSRCWAACPSLHTLAPHTLEPFRQFFHTPPYPTRTHLAACFNQCGYKGAFDAAPAGTGPSVGVLLVVDGKVPAAAGVSSSSALVVASTLAVSRANGIIVRATCC